MDIEIFFAYSFTNNTSSIYKINGQSESASVDKSSETNVKSMYESGWKLAHAIKTSQSAQFESFNFLLIFEK
tara:strand:- start:4 stop:219 length:216 start_codon:yes stop_codon:yes gene_type:complete